MTFKELLSKTDADKVVREWLGICCVDEDDASTVSESYMCFIQMLLSVDAAKTGKALFCCAMADKEFNVVAYNTHDLLLWAEQASPVLLRTKNLDVLSEEEMCRILASTQPPDAFSVDLAPRAEVLGCEVMSQNVQGLGADVFCAAVLCDITNFGFEEDALEKARAALSDLLADVRKIESLPQEERDKHYIDADEVFTEFGFGKDEETGEEKKERRIKLEREVLESRIDLVLSAGTTDAEETVK